MATSSSAADIVIAGAGIAGIATAWSLAERGVTGVVLVDSRPPLSLTSRRPEANYRAWWPQRSMVDLAMRSLELIEGLRADGATIPMDRRGYLYVSDDPATAATLGDLVAGHPATADSEATALGADELRRRWPHLGPRVLGGILVRRAGSLDTVALGEAMLDQAVARGVRVLRGELVGVKVRSGGVDGVTLATADGRVEVPVDVLVDAAGPFARDVAALAGADLPLETVLRQKVVIRDPAGVVPREAPFTITIDGRTLPWTDDERVRLSAGGDPRLLGPLPGGIHVKPDTTSGPDAIKLGWAWDQTPSRPVERPSPPPDFPRMVLLGASTIVPGLARYAEALAVRGGTGGVITHDGGFYARTPDGRPLIGPPGSGAPAGLIAVAGFAGFGAMMAAGAGEVAADWIARRAGSGVVNGHSDEPFDPRRFDDPSYMAAIRTGAVPTGEL